MLKIGLSGGIGSGKTFVGKVFKTLGIPVYDADLEARRLMEENIDVIKGVKRLFGESAYNSAKIDRRYIASLVFCDRDKLAALSRIVHPAVDKDFKNWVKQQEGPYVIEEAAILFESGAFKRMNYNIVVSAGKEERIRRVMERDSVTEVDVLRRMENQLPEEELIARADFVIINDNDSMILPQIVNLHNKFLKVNN